MGRCIKKTFFIVFEGIEGCGKSFQSKKLYKILKKKISSILTREPGGIKSAELIRNLILKDYFNKNSKEKFDKYTDTLLYLASRNEHIKNKIKPALKKKLLFVIDLSILLSLTKFMEKVDYNFIKIYIKDIRRY